MLLFLAACKSEPVDPWVDEAPPVVIDDEDPAEYVPATILINEVQSENESTLQVGVTLPDWVELVNVSDEPVALSRMILFDGSGDVWRGSDEEDAELAPGETMLILCDGLDLPGHAPFSIDNDGDLIELDVDGELADTFSTGWLPQDIAWARFPDGGAWDYTALPTPGWTNGSRPLRSTDARDGVYQHQRVIDVRISATEDNLQQLEDGWWGTRAQVPARIVIDGVMFDEVGLKLKGSGSFQPLTGKSAFKIDFDDFTPDRQYRGLDHLTLNNMNHDASYVHEQMTYAIYREAGIPAPRTGYARVWVNDTYYGLYNNLETHDNNFLRVWYGEAGSQGQLWEGMGDFTPTAGQSFHYESGPENPDTTAIDTIGVIIARQPTDENLAELDKWIDMHEFVRYAAIEALTMDWDGYQAPNNWRLWVDPYSNRVSLIPTGKDWTWDFMWSDEAPFYGNGQVLRFCLDNTECRKEFDQAIIEMSRMIDGMHLPEKLDDLTTWLDADIQADYRSPNDYAASLSQQENTRNNLANWPAQMRREAIADLERLGN